MSKQEILEGLYKIKNWKCGGDAEMHAIIEETIKALESQDVLSEGEKTICKMYLDDLDRHKSCNEYQILMGLIDGTITAQRQRNGLINRQAAIDAAIEAVDEWDGGHNLARAKMITDAINNEEALERLPSAEPEQPTGVQDILQYLDEYLHPIVSPEHWPVYSELYDMVSMLPSTEPERKTGKWIKTYRNGFGNLIGYCNQCGRSASVDNYCPNCGSYNGGERDGNVNP